MQRGHGAGTDSALKSMPHNQLVRGTQLRDEGIELGEVIAVIRISHDDKAAVRRTDAAQQCAAISLLRDTHNARARLACQLNRAIARAVVRDQNLADDPGALEEPTGLAHAARDRLSLIEAGHQNREFGCGNAASGHGALRVSRLAKGKGSRP